MTKMLIAVRLRIHSKDFVWPIHAFTASHTASWNSNCFLAAKLGSIYFFIEICVPIKERHCVNRADTLCMTHIKRIVIIKHTITAKHHVWLSPSNGGATPAFISITTHSNTSNFRFIPSFAQKKRQLKIFALSLVEFFKKWFELTTFFYCVNIFARIFSTQQNIFWTFHSIVRSILIVGILYYLAPLELLLSFNSKFFGRCEDKEERNHFTWWTQIAKSCLYFDVIVFSWNRSIRRRPLIIHIFQIPLILWLISVS